MLSDSTVGSTWRSLLEPSLDSNVISLLRNQGRSCQVVNRYVITVGGVTHVVNESQQMTKENRLFLEPFESKHWPICLL